MIFRFIIWFRPVISVFPVRDQDCSAVVNFPALIALLKQILCFAMLMRPDNIV
ncbi:MAG: hypothetical protein AWT59_2074 [Candidatus Gallionella acididurans]|uniref:Uncharacterized protein n=1 Tax=Candidatus Gallionella acididurans TaxID=1796491 RepID=A0A139BSV2_9PROT|nr:MAG: hypothetical protein AWT59_2074 [Candidatus Gallionella acididurans]